jgi:hypothetical protein
MTELRMGGMTELRRFGADRGSRLPGMLALAVAGALTAGAVACGRAPEVEPETAVDTLALLDRELDLAMSGETAAAELRDSPRGSRESGERPDRRPVERRSPPPPAPPSPSPETPPAEDPATAEQASATSGPGPALRSVAAAATFEVTLNQELSTRHNRVGDLFSATLVDPLTDGRWVLVPAGALVVGEVTAVEESGSYGQTAIINLDIHEVSFDGETYPLEASILEANPETRSRSSTGAKAAKIGGAAVVGAILGRVIGGDALGTIIGTAVGGAAGTAIVLGTDDVDAVLPRGSRMLLRLDAPLEMRVAMP